MAVYVDDLMACVPNPNWRWNQSCHLIADSLDELHAFAKSIGMKRAVVPIGQSITSLRPNGKTPRGGGEAWRD